RDRSSEAAVRRLRSGISHHAAGPALPALLARINGFAPTLRLDVRIAASREILASSDRGEIDAAIARREGDRRDGEVLLRDQLGWFAAPTYRHVAGEPVRLITLSTSCGVRPLPVRALAAAHTPCAEAFV